MKSVLYENIIFEIGQNAKENWEIFEKNKENNSNFLWFHLNSLPSSYVIMKFSIIELKKMYSAREIDKIMYYAANLCRENSKYKFLKDLKIVYATLKNLKKGEKEGEMIISGKKNLIKL